MRRWMAIAVVAPWAAWAIGRTLALDRAHPFIAIVAFTPYVAATAPLAVVVALLLRRRLAAIVATVAAVLLAVAVLPRGLGREGPLNPNGAGEATVMTSNLFAGQGDAEHIAALVRRHRVDVLVLQEMTAESVRRLDRAGLREVLPHRALEARSGGRGNGILSRHALRRVPAWERANEPAADIDLPAFASPMRVRVVHPFPPIGDAEARAWQEHLRALLPPPPGRPAVIAGDFNATLDHRDLRAVLDRGWVDAAAQAGKGWRATWPVHRRVLGLAIDHVLVSRGLQIGKVSIHEVPRTDHRAVIARVASPAS